MDIVDFTFGIDHKALAIAHLVNRLVDTHAYEQAEKFLFHRATSPWYNGREKGICFQVGHFIGPVLNICVFEHRNRDNICALQWESDGFGMNPPNIDKDGAKAYPTGNKWDVTHQVSYNQVYEMAEWIAEEMRNFLDSLLMKLENKEQMGNE